MPSTINAAGTTIMKFTLNLSRITQSCVFVDAIVVSDMNERLSRRTSRPPRWLPYRAGLPVFRQPHRHRSSATIVPTLVPIDRDMKQAAMKIPANSRLSGRICRSDSPWASMAPSAWRFARTLRRGRISISSAICSCCLRLRKTGRRCSSFQPRVMAMA